MTSGENALLKSASDGSRYVELSERDTKTRSDKAFHQLSVFPNTVHLTIKSMY